MISKVIRGNGLGQGVKYLDKIILTHKWMDHHQTLTFPPLKENCAMWYTKVCANNGIGILCHVQRVVYLVHTHYSEQTCKDQARAYYTPKHLHLHSSLYLWAPNYGGSWPCAIAIDMKHEAFERLLPKAQQQQNIAKLNNLFNNTILASN